MSSLSQHLRPMPWLNSAIPCPLTLCSQQYTGAVHRKIPHHTQKISTGNHLFTLGLLPSAALGGVPRQAVCPGCVGHTAPFALPAMGLEPSDLLVPPASDECCRAPSAAFASGLQASRHRQEEQTDMQKCFYNETIPSKELNTARQGQDLHLFDQPAGLLPALCRRPALFPAQTRFPAVAVTGVEVAE